jgi:3-hydroxyisobutyrate dehydrogenase-like beta-hydroxyacid dehydrogenase
MSQPNIPATAMVGLGAMGLPMAGHMLRHGFEVWGYDVDPAAAERAREHGVRPAGDLAELGRRAGVIVVMVQTDAQVEEVVHTLLAAVKPETVICVASSTAPDTCRELARAAQARGAGLLDTPVARGPEAAVTGTLAVFVGGEARWFERARPALAAFGMDVLHVGDSGAGQVTKIANNLLLWACMSANYEVLSFVQRLGVEPAQLLDPLRKSSGANWSLSNWGRSKPKWAEKDLDVALELAQQVKMPVPLTALVDQLMKDITPEKMRAQIGMSDPEQTQP